MSLLTQEMKFCWKMADFFHWFIGDKELCPEPSSLHMPLRFSSLLCDHLSSQFDKKCNRREGGQTRKTDWLIRLLSLLSNTYQIGSLSFLFLLSWSLFSLLCLPLDPPILSKEPWAILETNQVLTGAYILDLAKGAKGTRPCSKILDI